MHNKRLSLLIPKHQNKTSKEIAEMYVTQPRKPQKSLTHLNKNSEKKEFPSYSGKTSAPKPSESFSLTEKKAEKSCQETKTKSAYEISQEILLYSKKTWEIQNAFVEDERRMLKKIQESGKLGEKRSVRVNHKEIVENFKEDALEVDKRISVLAEENRVLKEKLALATLEEVDERIRREKPSERFVEKYSNKLVDCEPDPPISDLWARLSNSGGAEENSEVISSFCSGIAESSLQGYITYLCQQLSNNKKLQKKQEIDNKRLHKLKQEVIYRLQHSLSQIKPNP